MASEEPWREAFEKWNCESPRLYFVVECAFAAGWHARDAAIRELIEASEDAAKLFPGSIDRLRMALEKVRNRNG